MLTEATEAVVDHPRIKHEHSSTTAIYTCVSSDFRIKTLRRALDATLDTALRDKQKE